MNLDFIENLTEEQIIQLYEDVSEFENTDFLSGDRLYYLNADCNCSATGGRSFIGTAYYGHDEVYVRAGGAGGRSPGTATWAVCQWCQCAGTYRNSRGSSCSFYVRAAQDL